MPHFDKNENFTIQLTGAKRWQVGETPMVPVTPDSYTLGSTAITPALAPLLAEAQRPPERTVDLKPGTLAVCAARHGASHRGGGAELVAQSVLQPGHVAGLAAGGTAGAAGRFAGAGAAW